jgi:hypothetical protein
MRATTAQNIDSNKKDLSPDQREELRAKAEFFASLRSEFWPNVFGIPIGSHNAGVLVA